MTDKAVAKVVEKQLEGVSDAELGSIFRKLLISDCEQLGLCASFDLKKPPARGYDYSSPPVFNVYSPGCGCCSHTVVKDRSNVVDALRALLERV